MMYIMYIAYVYIYIVYLNVNDIYIYIWYEAIVNKTIVIHIIQCICDITTYFQIWIVKPTYNSVRGFRHDFIIWSSENGHLIIWKTRHQSPTRGRTLGNVEQLENIYSTDVFFFAPLVLYIHKSLGKSTIQMWQLLNMFLGHQLEGMWASGSTHQPIRLWSSDWG